MCPPAGGKLHSAFGGKEQFLCLLLRRRGQLCWETVTSFQWPHGEVSVELEAEGGEDPSAGELVWPMEQEASSAGGAARGG